MNLQKYVQNNFIIFYLLEGNDKFHEYVNCNKDQFLLDKGFYFFIKLLNH